MALFYYMIKIISLVIINNKYISQAFFITSVVIFYIVNS